MKNIRKYEDVVLRKCYSGCELISLVYDKVFFALKYCRVQNISLGNRIELKKKNILITVLM